MNTTAIEKIANAVLYEGYLLYPYRSSAIKNQQRFNFGVLFPREYCDLQSGAESSEMRTECLVHAPPSATIEAKIRFLQLVEREQRQEGIEREITTPTLALDSIVARPFRQRFTCGKVDDTGGRQLEAELELHATALDADLFRLTVTVRNVAPLHDPARDRVLLESLVSVHSILHVDGGEFVSSLDPPEQWKTAVAACHNLGAWPVLVGEEGQRDLILSSPIILYDYPEIAPESPGDLFDGTEIDEILALRILTMTDAEKQEVRSGDDRARRILERTEMLPPEHFQKLHGALRGLRIHPEEAP
jgi:hypothetical protein